MNKKKIIIFTGGNGRFGRVFQSLNTNKKILFPSKSEFNILSAKKMKNYIKRIKPNYIIHGAGLSRPMSIHDTNIAKTIDLNIIGTANIVKLCNKYKIKLIYFSTNYVYPGTKGNYKESDPLLPINNYAWSKLGGEAGVHLYKNSLILRLCMTDYPFVHSKAIKGAKSSFIYNKTVSSLMPFFLDEFGIINIGGKKRDIYEFTKKFVAKKITPISFRKIKNFPKDSSININKLIKLLRKKKVNFKKTAI